MIIEGTISAEDKKLFLFTDSIPEAVEYIKNNTIKPFGLKYKPQSVFGESTWSLIKK